MNGNKRPLTSVFTSISAAKKDLHLFSKSSVALMAPILLIVVALIVAATTLLPLAYLTIRTVGVGEEVWGLLFHTRTIQVFFNSVLLAVVVTALSILIAVPLAFITVRTDIPGRRFWSIATALPLAIPSYVGSFVIIAALAPRGSIVQNWLAPLGIERLPSIYGWPGAVLVLTLFTFPYILLTVRASLHGLDPALEEASQSLGYNRFETFVRVTLRHLYPSIAAGGLLVALYTLSDFGTPSLMRFDSFTREIYVQYQSGFDRNLAAVLSLLLAMLAAIVLFVEYKARGKARYYSTSPGSRRRPWTIELKQWRWPALVFCATVVGLALVMPLSVISFWFLRGVSVGESFISIGQLAVNSVLVSGLAALVVIPAAFPVAILAVRYPSVFTNLMERSTYVGFALPGIVVALSLVFFGANFATLFYQTMVMLILAYVVLFIPQAVGTIRSSLLQVNPRLEEAARSLGRGRFATLRLVTVPVVRSGILAGAALLFITTIRELPATLLLAPLGFSTLATRIWSTTEEALFAEAAASSLLLVAISGLFMTIILSHESESEKRRTRT